MNGSGVEGCNGVAKDLRLQFMDLPFMEIYSFPIIYHLLGKIHHFEAIRPQYSPSHLTVKEKNSTTHKVANTVIRRGVSDGILSRFVK
jgi:hypothetical protein